MKRRDVLKMLGGFGASMALPSIALGNVSPKRFLVFFNYHGVVYNKWTMSHIGNQQTHRWTAPLPSDVNQWTNALSPLHAFKERCTIIDGLALLSAEVDPYSGSRRHETAAAHVLTGRFGETIADLPVAVSKSLDQVIAEKVSMSSQFPSLEWGVGNPSNSPFYRGRHAQLSPELDPVSAYFRLKGMDNRDANNVASQQILMDVLNNRYSQTATKLSGDDRIKMEQHRDLISDLSQRIAGLQEIRQQCSIEPPDNWDFETNSDYTSDFDAFCYLVGTALSCDFTRVLSLNMGQLPSEMLSGMSTDVHGDYAHNIYNQPFAAEMIDKHSKINAEQFCQLASLLDGIVDPMGDGVETLLDNTMMLFISEVAEGTHSFERWPVVLLGGDSFSGFSKGKYIYHPSDQPIAGWVAPIDGNRQVVDITTQKMAQPHQKLLTSIAQSFGIETDHFGLQRLRGTNNELIDLTGPLQGLTG